MPYFKWQGITLHGAIQNGKKYAISVEQLDEYLFKKEIALLHSKTITNRFFYMPLRRAAVIAFWRQLAVLIDAGILIPDALALIAEQTMHQRLHIIVQDIAQRVQEGATLGNALKQYPALADQVIIQLIYAGEQGGNLGRAIEAICTYKENQNDFYARLQVALFLPLLTFIFFMIIALIIITMIVPRFVDIFTSLHQPIPHETASLLAWGNWFMSINSIVMIGCIGVGILIIRFLCGTRQGKYRADYLLLQIPGIGFLVKKRFVTYTMQSVGLLLDGGQLLVPSLQLVCKTINNEVLRLYLARVTEQVAMGYSLSQSIVECGDKSLFSSQSIAMIHIGEESGRLSAMIMQIASTYQMQVNQALARVALVVQPVLMIVLGLLITGLVFAVYLPIFNLSHSF